MKPKDRLKNIAKTLTTENGSIFFTSEDYDNMKWLINRVKKLEKGYEDILKLKIKFHCDHKMPVFEDAQVHCRKILNEQS